MLHCSWIAAHKMLLGFRSTTWITLSACRLSVHRTVRTGRTQNLTRAQLRARERRGILPQWASLYSSVKSRQNRLDPVPVEHYQELIPKLYKKKKYDRVANLLVGMLKFHQPAENNRSLIIKGVAAMKRIGKAGHGYDILAGIKEKGIYAWNLQISCLRTLSRGSDAFQAVQLVRKAGLNPDVVTLGSAIGACEKAEEWQLVQDLFREFENSGFKPRRDVFRALIRSYVALGQNLEPFFATLEKHGHTMEKDLEQYLG